MIRNFVFDFGNVLVDWHPIPYIMSVLGCTEETAREYDSRIFKSREWRDEGVGAFGRDHTRAELIGKYPDDAENMAKLIDGAPGMLVEYRYNTEILRKLKSLGYGLYYLSNTNLSDYEYIIGNCSFFPLMDGGLASFMEKMVKPSHSIFELFAERYDKNPRECCFIDDMEVNTLAASEVGFEVITLKNPSELGRLISKKAGVEV